MTIDEVWKRRVAEYKKEGKFPEVFIVSPEEKHELVRELRSLPIDKQVRIGATIASKPPDQFALFGVCIVTEQELRR